MPVKTKSGRALSDADVDGLATKAETGFDLSSWRPRPGRPSLGTTDGEHSPRIAVRVPEALRDRAMARAASEGRSVSEVVRGLLEEYAPESRPVLEYAGIVAEAAPRVPGTAAELDEVVERGMAEAATTRAMRSRRPSHRSQ